MRTSTFFCLMACVFTVTLGYGVALPMLPFLLERLLEQQGRASVSWHVGTMTGVYAFAMFLFAPLCGRLSDAIGRRPLILGGLGSFVAMLGVFGLSPSLEFAYVSRLLAGVSASAILPVAAAYIADTSAPSSRARRFAWMGAAALLGYLAGPMLGGWLADTSGRWSALMGWAGTTWISVPFLAAALLGAAVWLAAWRKIPEYPVDTRGSPSGHEMHPARTTHSVNVLLLLTLLMMFGLGSFEVGLTLHGRQDLGLGPGRLSQLFVACMLVMIVTQLFVFPFLIKRWSIHWVAPPAFAGMAAGLFYLPEAADLERLMIITALVAAGSGILTPLLSYHISLTAGSAQGGALGRQSSAASLGQAIGSVVAGLGFGAMEREPFWATAALVLMASALSAGFSLFSTRRVKESVSRS